MSLKCLNAPWPGTCPRGQHLPGSGSHGAMPMGSCQTAGAFRTLWGGGRRFLGEQQGIIPATVMIFIFLFIMAYVRVHQKFHQRFPKWLFPPWLELTKFITGNFSPWCQTLSAADLCCQLGLRGWSLTHETALGMIIAAISRNRSRGLGRNCLWEHLFHLSVYDLFLKASFQLKKKSLFSITHSWSDSQGL